MSDAGTARQTEPNQWAPSDTEKPIRVLVVDDSAVIRGLISRWLELSGKIQVIGTSSNGVVAINMTEAYDVEVIVLDVEMPQMDGLTALPKLIGLKPNVQVLMVSSITLHNADISLKALELGAADCLAKPSGIRFANADNNFKTSLVDKVLVLGQRFRHLQNSKIDAKKTKAIVLDGKTAIPFASRSGQKEINLNPLSKVIPKILAIGSSTGGPQALFNLLQQLEKPFPVPIVITQHMPPVFTSMLAQHIVRLTGLTAAEGKHGERLTNNCVYIAPGDRHMTVKVDENGVHRIVITDDAAENFCKPAVDPLFRSVARVFGDATLCLVLTGMGSDGSRAARDVINVGGSVIVQDEESSVVWGMPGAVAHAGCACRIEALSDIAPLISRLMKANVS